MAADETGQQVQEPQRPLLRVVRGEPTPEELAALVTVLTAPAAGATGAGPRTAARSDWHDPARLVRRPMHVGPDGWRSSGRPG